MHNMSNFFRLLSAKNCFKNPLIFNGVIQETAGQRFWTTVYNDLRCECIDGHDGAYLCVFRQLTRIFFC